MKKSWWDLFSRRLRPWLLDGRQIRHPWYWAPDLPPGEKLQQGGLACAVVLLRPPVALIVGYAESPDQLLPADGRRNCGALATFVSILEICNNAAASTWRPNTIDLETCARPGLICMHETSSPEFFSRPSLLSPLYVRTKITFLWTNQPRKPYVLYY
jgi:hypothetical protein